MEFTTPINTAPAPWQIDHTMNGLSLGSCFAANIAERLAGALFPVTDNPFGVLFNPASITSAIQSLAADKTYTEADLTNNGSLWCSFDFHGSFSAPHPAEALQAMNSAVERGGEALRTADYVIITFGTAWVYETEGRIVANCHKFPHRTFTRRRMSVDEIVDSYNGLLAGPLAGKKVIFTVSPVRHLKDGFAENSLSKAILRLAAARITETNPDAFYFPAFEIMTDDLRDYRFYGEDMVHPSAMAVDYIWEHFRKTFFQPETIEAALEAEKITAAARHRPLYPDTEEHRRFRQAMVEKIVKLSEKFPAVDFTGLLPAFSDK